MINLPFQRTCNEEEKPLYQGLMFAPFRNLSKFKTVYSQGELANKLFMVKCGWVKLVTIAGTGDQIIREIITEGNVFGDWSSIVKDKIVFQESAITLSQNSIIHYLNLTGLSADQKSNILMEFSFNLLAQKTRLEKRHQLLVQKNAAYRIRETLKDLALTGGQRFGNEILLKICLSHEDLANLADTSRQTVTKVMNELKHEGKIYYTRERILFRNPENIHQ